MFKKVTSIIAPFTILPKKKVTASQEQKIHRNLEYRGEFRDEDIEMQRFLYVPDAVTEENPFNNVKNLNTNQEQIEWLNLHGIHDAPLIHSIGNQYQLHYLLLEDVLDTQQRPKIDILSNHVFFTLKAILIEENNTIAFEQMSFVQGEKYVISFQERVGDTFEHIRIRLRENRGVIRTKGSDYLLYLLLDAVLENYFVVAEQLEQKLQALQEELLKKNEGKQLYLIEGLKQNWQVMRRHLQPIQVGLNILQKGTASTIQADSLVYYSDLKDKIESLQDQAEINRQMLDSATNLYLSEQSNKMNEVMKVLTIISTIFIPMGFLAGVYGMNFEHMPELSKEWAYPSFWVLIICLASGLLWYFKRKKWL